MTKQTINTINILNIVISPMYFIVKRGVENKNENMIVIILIIKPKYKAAIMKPTIDPMMTDIFN